MYPSTQSTEADLPHACSQTNEESCILCFIHPSFLQGAIQVGYRARAGNVTVLTMGQSLATAGVDFVSLPLVVTLEDGQQSTVIMVDILEVTNLLTWCAMNMI